MTTYLCIALIVSGLLTLYGSWKAATIALVLAITGGFGYRLYTGEEFRAVAADALFVIMLLPIGWWAAKQFTKLIDSSRASDDC